MDVLGAEGGGRLRVEDKVGQGGQETVQCRYVCGSGNHILIIVINESSF